MSTNAQQSAQTAAQTSAMGEAIDWMVRLRSGRTPPAEMAAFERWRAAEPAHASAWQRLEQGLERPRQAVDAIERGAAGSTGRIGALLRRPPARPSRRSVLGALAVFSGGGLAVWATHRFVPLDAVMADLRTSTGERRNFTLADGSRLTLNARSAADVAFDSRQRVIALSRGALVVQAAPDPLRPLRVRTDHVEVQVTGRCFVGLDAICTRVLALDQAVEVSSRDGLRHRLEAGAGAAFDARGSRGDLPVAPGAASWQHGTLSAAPLPLGDVVAALQAYTPGLLQISPAAARLSVHASLPLDDVPRALAALAETLPVRVRSLGPWWTRVELQM